MTANMRSLSPAFHSFFLATENLTAIHLGFPATKPLDLSLEQIFHRIHWKKLRTLSLQGWRRLRSDELIGLVRRHRRQLRNLRLISIYLDAGGRWRDVLAVFHDELEHLERIDLREIDYARRADITHTNGVNPHDNANPVADPAPAPQSDPAVLTEDLLSFSQRPSVQSPLPDLPLEKLKTLSADDLGDDGFRVKRGQRALWEAWVLSGPRYIARRQF
ncbi:F-box domain protein [Aspergillus sp. HF37]|nr:F-box domain protein [Aspergillus sp. HF37]